MLHLNRRRAESFGEDAEAYDRARPSYPTALVEDLVDEGVRRVLDVGCGTGKAGRLFAERGCDVLGVEVDQRMAEVARRHGLQVEVSSFEGWQPPEERFDLVVSGSAWHWVDPGVGPAKAAEVLRPGGRLAVFWNGEHLAPEVSDALAAAYRRHAPELEHRVRGRDWPPEGFRGVWGTEPMAATGRFEGLEVRSYPWRSTYGPQEWLDQLPTFSDHRMLPPATLEALVEDLAGILGSLGGSLTVDLDTHLVTGVRSA